MVTTATSQLRKYQQDVLDAIKDGGNHIVVAPTGITLAAVHILTVMHIAHNCLQTSSIMGWVSSSRHIAHVCVSVSASVSVCVSLCDAWHDVCVNLRCADMGLPLAQHAVHNTLCDVATQQTACQSVNKSTN